jgi:beta-glucanase (GH16 family)
MPTYAGNRSRVRSALIASAALLVIAVGAFFAANSGSPSTPVAAQLIAPVAPVAPPANWKLAFSTDFAGTSLDTSTWAECYPWSPSPLGCNNFGNSNEAEWYMPSQVHVDNGLALVAQRTPTEGTNEDGKPKQYTCRSGMVTTYPSVHFKYGFVQVVARLPFGQGLWPAIWLVPENGSWPPEIDIVEHWGTASTARATLHYSKQNKQQRGTVAFPQADQGYHTYSLYWTRSSISVYYDNKLALTTTKDVPQLAMYLLLDLADDDPAPGSCSGTMHVKSVNIWEPPQAAAAG